MNYLMGRLREAQLIDRTVLQYLSGVVCVASNCWVNQGRGGGKLWCVRNYTELGSVEDGHEGIRVIA